MARKVSGFTIREDNQPPYKTPRTHPHIAEQARRYNRPEDPEGELVRPLLNDALRNRAMGIGPVKRKAPPDMLNPRSKKYNPTKYHQENPNGTTA